MSTSSTPDRDHEDGASPRDDGQGGGQISAAISNAVVSVFADYLGRGPTRARTSLGRDLVTVILEETFTKAERRLIHEGEAETVVATRRTFQRTMRDDLVAAVERATGRTVMAFMSDQSAEPDVAAEIFVLEPERPRT